MNAQENTHARPRPDGRRRRSEGAPIIEVHGLSIGWGDKVIQKDLDFDVKRGEVFGILGGSGSGKSTLVRFLIGLEKPLAGSIDVAGRGQVDLDAGLPPFGVMFQAGALFGSMTVGENVALPLEEWTHLPADAIHAIARAKLRLVGLETAYDKFPSELSGGMKKRAAIARALALDPEIVFLDEPSAGLDPITSAELDDLILTLNEALGLTVVFVTHELESIFRIADRIIMLDKETQGIIADGDPNELRNSGDDRVSGFFNREPKATTQASHGGGKREAERERTPRRTEP
jgi:phospholipid/cholesterol/gamma-HCH transport system ATP-binding protein